MNIFGEADLYYTAPEDDSFEDMKKAALFVWGQYDEPYRSEKISRIKDIKNVGDNFMYILAMFDESNQRKVGMMLKAETRRAVQERIVAGGGTPPWDTSIL